MDVFPLSLRVGSGSTLSVPVLHSPEREDSDHRDAHQKERQGTAHTSEAGELIASRAMHHQILQAERSRSSRWQCRATDETKLTIQLQQIHLPKLADVGLLEYDPRSGAIALGELSEELREQLAIIETWEDRAVRAEIP